jgi:hypothetical protein
VRWFGPAPAEETLLPCAATMEASGSGIAGRALLRMPDGRPFALLDGVLFRPLAFDDRAWRAIFLEPATRALAEARPDGSYLMRETWTDPATREYVMRRYLAASERAEYQALCLRDQRRLLVERIAVKDAVRHRLWASGRGAVFPAEIRVTPDGTGLLRAVGPGPGERHRVRTRPIGGDGHPAVVARLVADGTDDSTGPDGSA